MDASLVETHVSVVFFLGDHAYKLKKPVRFPFADLSTRTAREAMCHREVELNRRLAPDVYEGVADIVGPDGSTCDHLVVMRRMPADRRLSTLVAGGDPRVPAAMDAIAELLASFHAGADRSAEISTAATADSIAARWRRNDEQMRPSVGSCFEAGELDRVMDLVDRFLAGRGPLLEDRIARGHVCDGHGDLLTDDIFLLDDGPRVLDCIEFDDDLRHVDVVDDLAFLVMDLEHHDATPMGEALVAAYEVASGEAVPENLLHFYVAYRAQVRAMVAALRAAQCEDPDERSRHEVEAVQLLHQCRDRLERGTVRLVMVGGLPGTGKTTVARALGDRTGWPVLRTDVARKQLMGHPADESLAAPFLSGIYAPEISDRTYDAVLGDAGTKLALGESVVLDASFSSDLHRAAARTLAHEAASELVELRCTVAADEAMQRIRSRRDVGLDASDADPDVAARLAEVTDPWPESAEVSTAGSVEAAVDQAWRATVARPG